MIADLVIKNCLLVNEQTRSEVDIAIKDSRIEKIASSISCEAKQEIDSQGNIIIPGVIDDQVHFREPGLTHKGSIHTETLAALAGGTTSFFEMPNVNPPTTNLENLEEKFSLGASKSHANYSFYFGASNTNIEEIKKLGKNDASGIKIFMGSSTGDMLVDDEEVLEQIFAHAAVPIVTHCEDTPMISALEEKYKREYGEEVPPAMHALIRSREACLKSSSFAVDLAKRHGSQLHILHLTTEDEIALLSNLPIDKKNITAEACVHHLFYSEKDYEELGHQIKCNPSIKSETDRQALLKALKDGTIDIIATDHAPHTWEEKQNSYFNAPSGLPLVQHTLNVLMELSHQGYFSIEEIVQKTSHNIADRFKIKDRGYIREGYYADLVEVNPNQTITVNKDDLYYLCGWSPLENKTLHGVVSRTYLNGCLVCADGRVIDPAPMGMKLEFNR